MSNQSSTLYFDEVVGANSYEIDVYENTVDESNSNVVYVTLLGTESVSTDDTVDGVDDYAGEIEILLGNISVLPVDASGSFTFRVFSIDDIGRSEDSQNIQNVDIDFTFDSDRVYPIDRVMTGVILPHSTGIRFRSAEPEGS